MALKYVTVATTDESWEEFKKLTKQRRINKNQLVGHLIEKWIEEKRAGPDDAVGF